MSSRTDYFREYMRKWRANEDNRIRENAKKRIRRARQKEALRDKNRQ